LLFALVLFPPVNPLNPTNLQQFQSDGTTALAPGGTVSGTTVVLKAVVNTTDAQAQLRLEVRLVAQAFTGTFTSQSALTNNGQTASLTVSGLAPGSYKWQAWIFCT
jgi:hypothetical protein